MRYLNSNLENKIIYNLYFIGIETYFICVAPFLDCNNDPCESWSTDARVQHTIIILFHVQKWFCPIQPCWNWNRASFLWKLCNQIIKGGLSEFNPVKYGLSNPCFDKALKCMLTFKQVSSSDLHC